MRRKANRPLMLKVAGAIFAGLASLVLAEQADALTFYTTQAAFNAAVPGATLLEDFSSAGVGLHVTPPPLSLPSGDYSGLAGTPSPNVYITAPGQTNYGADVGTTTQYILTANGDENIVANLAASYNAVGFDAFFNGLGPLTLTVFGSGGSVLDTYTVASGLDPATGLADKGYLGFTSSVPIFGFQWQTTDGATLNTGFTNISVLATPLPGTLVLLGSGLGGFGLLGWRKKKKAAAVAA